MQNFPQPRNQSDRRAGAILIAVGIGIGTAFGQLMIDNVGIGLLPVIKLCNSSMDV